ncbi:hypothetical protein E2562_012912 [Oryza meyeriana var. granulata]|uniref:DUF4408 domain-containing protein n=1 Tax=Oryza meyeriana var. granulata TaxID=110450 RepID=A0A6G1CFU8_9ORYZ|nr:hypothetical protein E2562_012912 [Oryza meyeriana var. granulata]
MAVEIWWWLSPGAAWFVFLNVIVGAIAVMSWLGQGATATPSSARRKLARTASVVVMERLRSVANFPFQYLSGEYNVTPLHGAVPEVDYFFYPREAGDVEEEAAQRSRVMLETQSPLKPEPPVPVREIVSATASLMAPPSAPFAAAAAVATAEAQAEAEEEEEESISLDEAYALARQAQARAPRPATDAADPVAAARKMEPAKMAEAKPRRARAEEVEGKAEVNARAERFIQQFREDLKLQRINSIINYTNALRRRGGSAAPAPELAR